MEFIINYSSLEDSVQSVVQIQGDTNENTIGHQLSPTSSYELGSVTTQDTYAHEKAQLEDHQLTLPNLNEAIKNSGHNEVRDSNNAYFTPPSEISTVKKPDRKIIGQNQVHDSTITKNLQKPSENGDDVEGIQTSDDLELLRNYNARFSKDPKSIIDNLQKASEN